MAQNREQMADILRELHYAQIDAMNLSVHSFEINSRVSPYDDEGEGPEGLIREYGDTEERYIIVTIFLRGDDSDDDYGSWRFYDSISSREANNKIIEIQDFISRVQD